MKERTRGQFRFPGSIFLKLSHLNLEIPNMSTPTTTDKKKHTVSTHNFNSFIYKLLKSCVEDVGVNVPAMSALNSMVNDLFERIATEAGHLAKNAKRNTLNWHDVEAAVKLIVPGELGVNAVREGRITLDKFTASNK